MQNTGSARNIDGSVSRMDPGRAGKWYYDARRPKYRQAAYAPEPAGQGPERELFSARDGYPYLDIVRHPVD